LQHNQQQALATLNAETNAHIAKTEKSIAANAVQIKVNAKAARDALDHANQKFQAKMFATRAEAEKSRSNLAATASSMDKKMRAMISSKVQGVAMNVAAQFAKVRATMAKDRAHADKALKDMSTKLAGSLNAAKVLQNKRFASTVKNIASAREEANKQVAEAQTFFKTKMLSLQETATEQVTKMSKRQKALQGTVDSIKSSQDEVNRHVSAEVKRMIKLGNDHEATLSNNDVAMRQLMAKNKDSNKKAMEQMANTFNDGLDKIKKQMAKDRAHSERNLKKGAAALYATLASNVKAQDETNAKLEAATATAKLDAEDNLRAAKEDFKAKLAGLHATVIKNDKKADKKIKDLVGIVDDDAVKNSKGREALKDVAKANKAALKTAVRNAIAAGEARALAVEKKAKDMTDKTRDAMNMKITNDIHKLAGEIHGSVEDLRLSSKEARASMKREILYAVRDSAKAAKDNLAVAVKDANKKMVDLNSKLDANTAAASAGREEIQKDIDSEKKIAMGAIDAAVKNQNKALLALKTLTADKIAKTNTKVDAYGAQVKKNAEDVGAQMKQNMLSLNSKLDQATATAKKMLKGKSDAAATRHIASLQAIKDGVTQAEAASNKKFTQTYADMGQARADADNNLKAASIEIQKVMAKNSALYDAAFQTTVKDIAAARAEAASELSAARKKFTTEIVSINSVIKNQETKLAGAIEVVSTEHVNNKQAQAQVNRHLDAEVAKILKLSDTNDTEGRKERGQIRALIVDHKAAAKAERDALEKSATDRLRKARSHMAKLRNDAAVDLSDASAKLGNALTNAKVMQDQRMKSADAALTSAKVSSAASLKRTKEEFTAKMTTLSNTITADNTKFEKALAKVTGVAHDWKKAAGDDRALMRTQIKSMENDLNKAIVKAIDIGEARMTRVQMRAISDTEGAKKALMGTIAESVESMADDVFGAVQENRAQIADNYLALKAYCGSKSDDIIEYVGKGKGKALFALGDLMMTVAALDGVKTPVAEGMGFGGDKVSAVFGGGAHKVGHSLSKTNGLVNEWATVVGQVRQRWPYGLGHYLLTKTQFAMQKDGLLTIGKTKGKEGQYVYINSHAIGLSNRLEDFEALASKQSAYQRSLTHLTATLPKHKKKIAKKKVYVSAPEYQGN